MIAFAEPHGGTAAADLSRLADTDSAVILLADVPGLLGLTTDEASVAVAGLLAEGSVELWPDYPHGPALSLSSAAGARLGLEIIDTRDGGLRWVRSGHPGERVRVRKGGPHEVTETDLVGRRGDDNSEGPAAGLDGFADPKAVDPAKAIRDNPTDLPPGQAARERSLDRLLGGPRPFLILGIGVAWPVAPDALKRCGVCGWRKLKRGEYCAWCDRAGAEPPITRPAKVAPTPTPRVVEPAPPKGGPGPPQPAGLVGGVGKAHAKPKRKAGKVGTGRNSFDLEALRARSGA